MHNQKILIVAGFFASEAFVVVLFLKKWAFFSLLLMFENASWVSLPGNNQKILIVAIWIYFLWKFGQQSENSDNNQKILTAPENNFNN